MDTPSPHEIELFEQMAKHTISECANCRIPYSCCEEMHCQATIDYARDRFGIELQTTGNPRAPLLGSTGCTVEPYLRPICTVHTCEIASYGCKQNDPAWTARYFELRNQIDEICAET